MYVRKVENVSNSHEACHSHLLHSIAINPLKNRSFRTVEKLFLTDFMNIEVLSVWANIASIFYLYQLHVGRTSSTTQYSIFCILCRLIFNCWQAHIFGVHYQHQNDVVTFIINCWESEICPNYILKLKHIAKHCNNDNTCFRHKKICWKSDMQWKKSCLNFSFSLNISHSFTRNRGKRPCSWQLCKVKTDYR